MPDGGILHMVAYDVSRGAERYARALVDALNRAGPETHSMMTLFRGDESTLRPDHALDVPRGALRALGLDPRVVVRMRGVIRDTRPHSLVAHGGEPAKYAAFAARGLAPYAYLAIGSSHPRLSNPLRRSLRKSYLERAAAIVAVSDALAEEIRREAPSVAGRVRIIPNGRDPQVYRPGPRSRGRAPSILFVGHFDDQKRPMLFVDAIQSVVSAGAGVSATMVGGGPLLEDVGDRAAPLGIRVIGPRDDVPELMRDADLLVVTSRPPEGLPGVLIEAGLSGLAVVTTDVPGARDVVEDGVTGRVVPVDDELALFSAVADLVSDTGKREEMGRRARERCLARFTIEATVGTWRETLAGMTR